MQMHIKILAHSLFMQEMLEAYRVLSNRKSAANITKKHSAEPNAFSKHLRAPENEEENTGSFCHILEYV